MIERNFQNQHHSDSDAESSRDYSTLAPPPVPPLPTLPTTTTATTTATASDDKHKFQKARTTLRFASSKLNLINNPVQESKNVDGSEGERLIHGKHTKAETIQLPDDEPLQFTKREAASTSELFYDLWFVANLNVFATVHPVTEIRTLGPFIGYFLLLWITWFITTVFDARFGQDGIFERLARASHLTVMIGFAIVGVTFDQADMIRPVFKATSLFLMMSRLVLAAQYGLVLFHARHHRRGRQALMSAVGLHLVPALGYLIAAFVVTEHQDHQLPLIWYVLGLVEMAAIIVHATFSKTLSFEGTHFNERLNLLTLIILGEGVIILAKNISKIVEYTYMKELSDHWSSSLVGILLSAGASLYIIFQLYFDWMHHHSHMKTTHQAYWTLIHLPFHIALVLLAEGGSQWAVWWRAMEAFQDASATMRDNAVAAAAGMSTSDVVDAILSTAKAILKKYGSDIEKGGEDASRLANATAELLKLPDTFWERDWADTDPEYVNWSDNYLSITSTVMNAIADAFDLSVDKGTSNKAMDPRYPELQALEMTGGRLKLIFVYMYISAGLVLILLMLMAIVSKRKGWSVFNMTRTGIVFTIGIGLCLVSLVNTNRSTTVGFLRTPWPLPTITICFFIVLVITHLPHPPRISFHRPPQQDVELGRVTPEGTHQSASTSVHSQRKDSHDTDIHPVTRPALRIDTGSGTRTEESVYQADPGFRGFRRERQTMGGIEGLHAQLPGHYDVGRQQTPTSAVKRGATLRRGLTSIQRAAKSIHFEAGGYDPIAEGDLFFQGGSTSAIRTTNLYSV